MLAPLLLLGMQFSAALNADTSGGVLPAQAGQAGDLGMAQSVSPTLTLRDPDAGFLATYSPRAYWRFPNELRLNRPAILHTAGLSHRLLRTNSSAVGFTSSLSVGEADYSAVTLVFGQNQTTAPSDPFIRVFAVSAAPSLDLQLSRRVGLGLSAPVSFQTSTSGAGTAALGSTRTLGLQSTVGVALTAVDRLGISAGSGWTTFRRDSANRSDNLISRISFSWSRGVTDIWSLSTSAGLGRLDVLRATGTLAATRQTGDSSYFGIAGVSGSRQRRMGAESVALGLDTYPDPVQGSTRSQGSLSAASSQRLSKRASLGVGLSAASSISRRPLPQTVSETSLAGNASVTWDLATVSLRSGLNLGVRGPHWSEPFEAREQQASVFFGMTWQVVGDR